jgi:hypothetical protein
MASTEKVSVTIDHEALAWMRKRARKDKSSLSAVFTEAARLLRQNEARGRVLDYLGASARLTPKQAKELGAEWGD